MRLCMVSVWAIVLGGCATLTGQDEAVAETEAPIANSGLAPQTLASGECGLFGWARDNGRFVFYSTPEEAQFETADGILSLAPQDDFPATDYSEGVSLELGEGEALEGGFRYPNARLLQDRADGFSLIQPIVVVTSCAE